MVSARSYSRISGRISAGERDRDFRQLLRSAISRMRRSCASFANALISDTVIASTPCRLSLHRASRALASSSSRTTSPRAPIRSLTSTVFSSAASGSGSGPDNPSRKTAGHIRAPDLENLAIAFGRDQPDPRAFSFQHRIGGGRGAVHQFGEGGRFDSRRSRIRARSRRARPQPDPRTASRSRTEAGSP